MMELPVDTVVFAIGDVVDHDLGLAAIKGGWGYTTNPTPDPQDPEAATYQAYDPEAEQFIDGVFVIGWSRNASEGVVGKAKLDGEKGASVINRFLAAVPGLSRREIYERIGTVYHRLREESVPVVHKGLWRILEQVEWEEAGKRGLEEFKFGTNNEMVQAIGEKVIKRQQA